MRRGDASRGLRRRARSDRAKIRALPRRRALLWALALILPLSGCATKKDVKLLGDEVARLQARQDSLVQRLEAQNRALMDTLQANSELLMRVRGDLGRQLMQMEQHLVQIQELSGQSQRRLTELREQWETRNQQFSDPGLPSPSGSGGAASDTDVVRLYELGLEKLQEGATGTARAAFQEILSSHVTHELAPDAQYQIGETYVVDEDFDAALRAFERLIELFPSSSRAATALFRAGVVSEERGNISRARDYFTRVQAGYPNSDEARLAAERLRRLRNR